MFTTIMGGRVYEYNYCIGMQGAGGPGRGFTVPVDFTMGANGVLYVLGRGASDIGGQRITVCDINHELLGVYGGPGDGDGQFRWPTSIDTDRDENLYISDEWLTRISIFHKDGKFLGKWGKAGSGDGEFNRPSGLAFGTDENLYIVDSLNNRVQVFTKEGKFLSKWGREGSGDGEFNMPWGIYTDTAGDVYVADWHNSRVQKFAPDGKFLVKFEVDDADIGEIDRPVSVAVDSDGDVYITDWSKDRLQIFEPDGTFITSLYGDAEQPSSWAEEYIGVNPDYMQVRSMMRAKEAERVFLRPIAVNIDAQDRIFVLENGRHRIQVYDKVKEFTESNLNL